MTAQSATDAQMRMRNDAGSLAAMVDRIRLQAARKKGGEVTGRSVSGAIRGRGAYRLEKPGQEE